LHVGENTKTPRKYTYILIEFDKILKISNDDYFNYNGVKPYVRIIKFIKHFNKFMML